MWKQSQNEVEYSYLRLKSKDIQQIRTKWINLNNQLKSFLKENLDNPQAKSADPIREYVAPIPFFQRLKKHKLDQWFEKFHDVLKKLHINIQFIDAIR